MTDVIEIDGKNAYLINFWNITNGYYISDDGDTYSAINNQTKEPYTKMSPYPDKDGYFTLHLFCKDKKRRSFRVHRLVAKMFCYNDNEIVNNIVLHLDNNKQNNHWTNLKWGTIQENTIQAYKDGLCNAAAKVTVIEPYGIIEHEFYSQQDFCRWYGIPTGSINSIKKYAIKHGEYKGKYERLIGCKINFY